MYEWWHPLVIMERVEQGQVKITVGEEVWVKLPDACCTTCWGRGTVTEVLSKNKVTVNSAASHTRYVESFPATRWRGCWWCPPRRTHMKVAMWAKMPGLDGGLWDQLLTLKIKGAYDKMPCRHLWRVIRGQN